MRTIARWLAALTVLAFAQLAPGLASHLLSRAKAQSPAPNAAALAGVDCGSAHRPVGVDSQEYFEVCLERRRQKTVIAAADPVPIVYNAKVAVSQANFSAVPSWSNSRIREHFRFVRDKRFMYASDDASFIRRNSWLWPDDGCFARAELAGDMIGDTGTTKPYKLFSFGNLRVTTPNHPQGFVEYTFHVAPVIRSTTDGQIYVLDPALDPTKPLPWQTWLLRQVTNLNLVNVTVADPNAYTWASPVTGGPSMRTEATNALSNQYLIYERTRQVDQGRIPSIVLGDSPPWKRADYYVINNDLFVFSCSTCTSDAYALTPRCFTSCP